MAGKGRKVASKASQLNRKRKKGQKGPGGIPTGAQQVADPDVQEPVAVSVGVVDTELDAQEAVESVAVPVETAPAPRRPTRPSPVAARTDRGEFIGQNQGRLRGERPAAYLYVGAELRRILALTAAILAALVVLGLLL